MMQPNTKVISQDHITIMWQLWQLIKLDDGDVLAPEESKKIGAA